MTSAGPAEAKLFRRLHALGFQIVFQAHAEAILGADFPEAVAELEEALATATIPIEEIVAGGGGEAKGTQRLRKALESVGWPKHTFRIEKRIDDVPRESVSHEVDHVRRFPSGARIALEIEWNNKDPFFDRDLENFKRLHADGAISAGVIVTRGRELQGALRGLVGRFLDERRIETMDALQAWGYSPTVRQRRMISERMERLRAPMMWREAVADVLVSDKFGEATTHWRKLEDRVQRGVGNPCPLLLIGLPVSVVTFDGGREALEALAAEPE